MCPPSIIDIAHIFPLLWFLPTSLPTSQRETGRERKEKRFCFCQIGSGAYPRPPGEGVEVVAGVASASSKIPYVMERGKVIDGRLANNFWLVAPEQRAVPLRIIDGIKIQGNGASVRAAPCASVRNGSAAPGCSQPLPHRGMEPPKAQMCDADHRRARRGLLYRQQQDTHVGRRGTVMTWTSDRAGVVLYTVLGMLIVLSSIYIPA
jgi:hypothetical protein